MLATEYVKHPDYYWDYVVDPFKTCPESFMKLFQGFYYGEPKSQHLVPTETCPKLTNISMGGKCLRYVMRTEVLRFWEKWGFDWVKACEKFFEAAYTTQKKLLPKKAENSQEEEEKKEEEILEDKQLENALISSDSFFSS